MDRLVAIKVLRTELVSDPLSLKRFQQESKAASMLSHPNVIGVHDFDVTGEGVPYLIMDFVNGLPISTILRREGQMEPRRCVTLFSQACSALAHAHSKGVVHRDIKPSNLMVVVDDDNIESIKLVDFGIAKLLEFNKDKPRLTMTGEIFGSPTYMSPEQCSGKQIDKRSDIYSLGCVIYECLMGEAPIRGETLLETIYKHSNETPLPFAEKEPDLTNIPKGLEVAVLKALEKSPDKRHQTMSEFDAALRLAFQDSLTAGNSAMLVTSKLPGGAATNRHDATVGAVTVAPNTVSFTGQIAERNFACVSCGKANPLGLIYCQYCGENATDPERKINGKLTCAKCGGADAMNSQFCTACGTALARSIKGANKPGGSIAAVIIAALLVVAGGGAWFYFFPPDPVRHQQQKPVQPVPPPEPPVQEPEKPVQEPEKPRQTPVVPEKPWITIRQALADKDLIRQALAEKGSKRQALLDKGLKWKSTDYDFHAGDSLTYDVTFEDGMTQPCLIYLMDRGTKQASLFLESRVKLSKQQKSLGNIEFFGVQETCPADQVVAIASPRKLDYFADPRNKLTCDSVFDNALKILNGHDQGMIVSENDLGIGDDKSPALFIAHLETKHSVRKPAGQSSK